jgi:hypothetical protein
MHVTRTVLMRVTAHQTVAHIRTTGAQTFRIEGSPHCKLLSLAVSPSEDTLAVATDDNQLYSLSLGNTDILKEDAMNFEHIAAPFHAPPPPLEEGQVNFNFKCLNNYLTSSIRLVQQQQQQQTAGVQQQLPQ